MSTEDTRFAWWSRLRHSGLLLSPVVQIEKYAEEPGAPKWYQPEKLRTAYTRFIASIDRSKDRPQLAQGDILTWVDALLENYVGLTDDRLHRSHSIPESLTAVIRIGSRTETLRPDRVLFDADGKTPLLLVKADTSPHIGRGKGRTEYARFLELLRGCGHRLGLLTNGLQFRLIYAGLDFESWCEWESERWFEDTEGTEELLGFRQLLFPTQAKDNKGEVTGAGLPGLLNAIEESRKRQADLSQVLRENVRQAVELLLEDVSNASRTDADLFHVLMSPASSDKQLTDTEAHEALLQATVRVVMRMVVSLFAESRGLLPVNDLVYSQAYGVRTLYELLDENVRHEGSPLGLMSRQSAWPRLMAVFRLIHGGSAHAGFPLRPYGGALFRPGQDDDSDAVSRALFILEHKVDVNDATIYRVLKKLLRGPLPVIKGKSKTYVEGPVDYTELRTEFIGLIYEGLLDYRVKRTTEEIGPQVFLNLGRQPVLPLSRLESMLNDDPKGLKELLGKLKKEKVTATVESEDDDGDDVDDSNGTDDGGADVTLKKDKSEEGLRGKTYLDAVAAARHWAREAIVETKLITAQRKKETDTEYDKRIEDAVDELIDRVVSPGEFYLVRAGNTRKGTGTFYTRPQLAVPTVHRTLEPMCFVSHENGTLTPKTPEEILGLKLCDPACGSASFLVAGLHYLTDALYRSLCHHCGLDDPKTAAKITLPFGRPSEGKDSENLVPLPPDDPNRGEEFSERVQALLRRHIVERCIYGVDINPLAVEFARVSMWVETLDPELPFSFLDHKIKVGNALVGCWLHQFQHYPIAAWERTGGDDVTTSQKGERTLRIETWLKGEKGSNGRRSGDGIIKQEMRTVITERRILESKLFADLDTDLDATLATALKEYEALHDLPINLLPEEHERLYRERIESSEGFKRLHKALDEWCAIWFWPSDKDSLEHIPMPLSFQNGSNGALRRETVARLSQEIGFFHWELEFPDVFARENSGFDVIVGNPPWETMQQESKEFFSEFDPVYRTYGKQAALQKQRELFESDPMIESRWRTYGEQSAAIGNWVRKVAAPYEVSLASGNHGKELANDWRRMREKSSSEPKADVPFAQQGSGKLFSYKLFTEIAVSLTNAGGRFGLILPSGIYTDSGTSELRRLFLTQNTWDWLFSFENRLKIFDIHGAFKFAVTIVDRHVTSRPMRTAFMVFNLGEWESTEPPVYDFDPRTLSLFSPNTGSIPELRGERDFEICRTIYEHSHRIGDNPSGWEIDFSREFNMTDDSKHFPPLEKWKKKGFQEDVFGRWIGPKGEVALPLYEGRIVGQFNFSSKGWVEGKGRTAVWRDIPLDSHRLEPQFLMAQAHYEKFKDRTSGNRVAFMDVSSSTNSRSMIAAVKKDLPSGNSAPVLSTLRHKLEKGLLLVSALNSFSFDFTARQRMGGIHLNWFLVEECPIPRFSPSPEQFTGTEVRLLLNAARLNLTHRSFAPEWLLAKERIPDLDSQEWKRWWAITEADRLRLRVECDALVASLYGIKPEDFEWIVRNEPDDPKGFWRVDKELDYEQRLTGLSARAFRALKDGKWSAETAAALSNDEFFEILGIPELTNAEAAKAKNLSGPLILKREGCHSWQPENFPKDDPRHGWTWEDCRNDAIALLGSEEALEEYIAQATGDGSEGEEDEEPFQLISEPAVKKDPQGRLF